MNDIQKIQKFARLISGKCYLVGGAVIDRIMGNLIKDWDIEVYGVSFDDLDQKLAKHGLPSNKVGASFGIIKTSFEGLDIDLSVPRRENRIGKGHRDFEVTIDADMTVEEAARRRDLTINAMSLDLDTLEIVDPFGGRKDLEAGILRCVDPLTFVEDPLRVLRIMQLLPRKGKTVAKGTIHLCASMDWQFSDLSKERVFDEFVKLLIKSSKPSMGIKFLLDCGWITSFPELDNLIGCPQHPEWHPEGDVFEHTCRVIDAAAHERDNLPEEWRLPFMFGALLHDVGKPSTTKEDFTSYGHDVAGGPIAEKFMRRITDDKQLIERVLSIVVHHMRCGQLEMSNAKTSAYKRLHNDLRLDVAAMMSKCDSCSRYKDNREHEPSKRAMEYFEKFGEKKIPSVLMGRHLIENGMKPGPEFKKILDAAYEIQIEEGIEDPWVLYEMAVNVSRETANLSSHLE